MVQKPRSLTVSNRQFSPALRFATEDGKSLLGCDFVDGGEKVKSHSPPEIFSRKVSFFLGTHNLSVCPFFVPG